MAIFYVARRNILCQVELMELKRINVRHQVSGSGESIWWEGRKCVAGKVYPLQTPGAPAGGKQTHFKPSQTPPFLFTSEPAIHTPQL